MRASRWRKLAQALIAVLAVTLLGGCSGGSAQSTRGASPSGGVVASETPTANPSETETANALDAALVQQLIAVANETGYGPADEAFADVMTVVCRDVASGHTTWDEVIAQDVADGASKADAKRLYTFVRDQLCPALPEDDEEKNPQGDKDAGSDGTRGLGSKLGHLDANWDQGDAKRCRAVFGASAVAVHAFARDGVAVCADEPLSDTWGDTVIGLDLAFEPAVSEKQARQMALQLLPDDAVFQKRVKLNNPGWAARKGSCVSVVFKSAALNGVILAANPDWSDANLASATLYSDKQTDYGSGSSFDGTVRAMSLGIGGTTKGDNC